MGVFMGKKKSLVLYSDSRCPVCAEVKAYLESKGVSFKIVDIDSYPELRGMPFAPVICQMGKKGKKGKCQIGFNEKEIQKLIQGKKRKK